MTEHPTTGAGPRVAVIGESLIDIVRAQNTVEAPGGSPLNVAVALSRLGVDTRLLTALGNDERADLVEKHLAASGVELVPGSRRLLRTSTATATLRPDGSAVYDFDVTWDPPALPSLEVEALHAGSIGLFLQPGAETVRDQLEAAAGRTLISLDPNIRPSLLPNLAAVRSTFESLAGLATVVKLSDEDAEWLFPGAPIATVVQRLLDLGPALVAVTRGAAGCLLASTEAAVDVAASATTVVDTIGAGDSFMGALIRQVLVLDLSRDLIDGLSLWPEELAEIGRFAADVAAATVGRPGADPPWLHELAGSTASLGS